MALITDYQMDAATKEVIVLARLTPESDPFTIVALADDSFDEQLFQVSVHSLAEAPATGTLVWLGDYFTPRDAAPSPLHTWDWAGQRWAITLDNAKRLRVSQINDWATQREFSSFTWQGHVFDATPDALRRLAFAATAASQRLSANPPYTVTWTLADNTTLVLSAQDVLDVNAAYFDSLSATRTMAQVAKSNTRGARSMQGIADLPSL